MNKLKECPCCGYPQDDIEAKAMQRILNKIKADAVRDALEYEPEGQKAFTSDCAIEFAYQYADKLERGEL